MKKPYLNIKRSFSNRLTIGVILTVALIFIIIFVIISVFIGAGIQLEARKRAHAVLNNTNLRINNVLNSVEVAVQNNIFYIKNNLDNPQMMFDITRRIVDQNPSIYASSIAFEPNYYKKEGIQFAPYSYRDTDGSSTDILTIQLGNEDYEYHYMDWYQIPKLLKTDYWSEPYYDSGGGEKMMTTYSYPLENEQGDIIGIVTADISLDWLTKLITNIKYHDEAYNFVVSRTGTFIVHPDTTKILNETLFTKTYETSDSLDEKIAYSIIAGQDSMVEIKMNDTNYMLFYSPIKRVGWSMGIICPKVEFFSTGYAVIALVAFIMLIGLLILALFCRKVVRRISKPLTYFAKSVDEITKGNIQASLPEIKSQDEMKTLRDSFEVMQHSLTARIEELKTINEQKGRFEGELQAANNIQLSMIPKTFPPYPDREDIDIYGLLEPAKQVGGDLYDFYIRDEKLFFCIGDVSGKGVPAALVMAVTRSLFRTISTQESLPQRIMTQINESMVDMNETMMFVTMIVGALDLPTGRLRYCNAGHCAPLLIGGQNGYLPIISNVPVGIMTNFRYSAQETVIDSGTSIFLYTDGLTEAEDSQHHQYGENRLIETANSISQDSSMTAESIIRTMNESVHTFVGSAEQSDDLTLLAINYRKPNRKETLNESITLPNDIETIPELNAFVDDVCERVGFDMPTTASINLALEEAVVNVMNYAYPATLQGTIDIRAIANDIRIKFIISDNGIPFDPTTRADADITLSAEERPIGGLGIHLVRQIMDSVNYERIGEMNVLTLRKSLVNNNLES